MGSCSASSMWPMALGRIWVASCSASVLMSRLCTMRLTLALIQRWPCSAQVDAACDQRLVVHPGDGGLDFAGGLEELDWCVVTKLVVRLAVVVAVDSSQSPRDTSTSRSSTMPAPWPGGHVLGLAGMVQHLGHLGGLAAGQDTEMVSPGCTVPVATRPQNTRRPWVVSAGVVEFFDPLHRERKGHIGLGSRYGQVVSSRLSKAGAGVAAPARRGGDHVVAFQSGHRQWWR